jgi:hypothetical protein
MMIAYALSFPRLGTEKSMLLIWQGYDSKFKTLDEEGATQARVHNKGSHLNEKYSSRESATFYKVPKGLKSFSHELGPKGGIPPAQPRAHSYSNLEVLLNSWEGNPFPC